MRPSSPLNDHCRPMEPPTLCYRLWPPRHCEVLAIEHPQGVIPRFDDELSSSPLHLALKGMWTLRRSSWSTTPGGPHCTCMVTWISTGSRSSTARRRSGNPGQPWADSESAALGTSFSQWSCVISPSSPRRTTAATQQPRTGTGGLCYTRSRSRCKVK
jgi:hypothetical protein